MDTSKTESFENTPKNGLHMNGLDVNEVLEVSEQLSDLDHETKSMLFLLSLSTFNELQNKFVDSYKKLLQCKKTNKTRITEEELTLFNVLKESQNNFLNRPLEEDERESRTSTDSSASESSLLRSIWRRYRIELFVKVMLIIFLLKLPYFCYIFTTVVYILYCFGFFRLVLRLSLNLRNSQNAQSLARYFVNIVDTLEPLLMMPSTQDPNAQQPQTQPTTAGPRSSAGSDSRHPRSTVSSTDQPPVSVPPQPVQQPSPFPQPTSPPERQVTQPATLFGPQTQSESQQSQPTTSEQPEQVTESTTSTTSTTTRVKPTYIEKFIYQVFFSFILSLLPWWEPNPIYLEES